MPEDPEGARDAPPGRPAIPAAPPESSTAPPAPPVRPMAPAAPPRPFVTYAILAVLVALWLLTSASGGSSNVQTLIRFGAQQNELIWQGQWWRLVTPIFLHFGIVHLALNGVSLYIVGSVAEPLFGRWRYLLLFFGAGVGGTLAGLLFDPRPTISVGASGAIFGLLGALLYIASLLRKDVRGGFLRALLFTLAINLGYDFFVSSNINNYAHIGGLVCGGVLAVALGAAREPAGRQRWRIAGALALAALLAVGIVRWPHASSRWTYDFDQGVAAYQAGDWQKAHDLFQDAVTLYQGEPSAYYNLALADLRLGNVRDARAMLKQALAVDPKYDPAQRLLQNIGGQSTT